MVEGPLPNMKNAWSDGAIVSQFEINMHGPPLRGCLKATPGPSEGIVIPGAPSSDFCSGGGFSLTRQII